MSTPKTSMDSFNFSSMNKPMNYYDTSPYSNISDRSPTRYNQSPNTNYSSIETSPSSENNSKLLNIIPFKFKNVINEHVDLGEDYDNILASVKRNNVLPAVPQKLISKHNDSFSLLPSPKFYKAKIISEIETIVSNRKSFINEAFNNSGDDILKNINSTQYFHLSSPKLNQVSSPINHTPIINQLLHQINRSSPRLHRSLILAPPILNHSSPKLNETTTPCDIKASSKFYISPKNSPKYTRCVTPKDISGIPKLISASTPKDIRLSPKQPELNELKKSPSLNSEDLNRRNSLSISSPITHSPHVVAPETTNLASLLHKKPRTVTKVFNPAATSFFNNATTRMPSKLLTNANIPSRSSSLVFSKEISESVPKSSVAKVYSFGAFSIKTNPLINKKPIVNNLSRSNSVISNSLKDFETGVPAPFKLSSIAPPSFSKSPDTKLECELSPEVKPRPIPSEIKPDLMSIDQNQFNSKSNSKKLVKSALAFMHAQDQSVAFASGTESIINAVPTRLLDEFSRVNLSRIRTFDTINRGRVDLLSPLESSISNISATNSLQLSGRELQKKSRVLQKFDPFE